MSAPISYAPVVAITTILVFFSNAALYLFETRITEIPPLWWVAALVLLCVPLVLRYAYELAVPTAPFVLWTFFYFAVSLGWYAAFPPSEAADAELRRRVLAIGYLGMVWAALQHAGALLAARRAVLAATLVGVSVNAFEFMNPGTFSSVPGRAAGLYINPNISGAALVLGMLASSRLLGRWSRIAFVLTVGLGVAATLSRAAMLGWLAIAASLLAPEARAIGLARLVGSFALAMLAAGGAVAVMTTWQDGGQASPLTQALADRFSVFDADHSADFSTHERRELIDEALASAAHRPFAGAGLGANRFLARETGSHNQYLDHVVQHGVLGMSILPLLAAALVVGATGAARSDALRFACFVLFWGMFSHNLLDEWPTLTAIALQAAIGRESQASQTAAREQQSPLNHIEPPMTQTPAATLGTFDLARFGQIVRARWLLIAATAILTTFAAGGLAIVIRPSWEAIGVVQIGATGGPSPGQGPVVVESPIRAIERMRIRAFQDATLARIGAATTNDDPRGKLYRDSLKLRQLQGTDFVEIKVRGYSPEESARSIEITVEHLANVHAQLAAPSVERLHRQLNETDANLQRIQQGRERLLASDSLKGAINPGERFAETVYIVNLIAKTDEEIRAIEVQRAALMEQLSPTRTYPTALVEKIHVSEKPVSPRTRLMLAVAALFGISIGTILACVLEGRKTMGKQQRVG